MSEHDLSASAPRPIWDRGDPIDAGMLAFTTGDDPRMDRRLVLQDITGSAAHAAGLRKAGLITPADYLTIIDGLERLLASWRAGEWDVEDSDEDVHSAVERRLIELIGEPGKRLHTGRSRNDQIATDVRLWLRDAITASEAALATVIDGCRKVVQQHGGLPIPGYTHLRRGMPSTIADWMRAHARALEADLGDLEHVRGRIRECPLGTGAGYGIPLALERVHVAELLGFECPEEPVTLTQHTRGRAELSYLTALEAVALDLGKLASDLWLYTTREFGFLSVPVAFTTGSSLMPQKRNPDVIELVRAHARQVVAERANLLDVLRDLPSGYHRDFQLIKGPLFRAHDRIASMLPLLARLIPALEVDAEALERACDDESLRATEKALQAAKEGRPFRDAYREQSRRS